MSDLMTLESVAPVAKSVYDNQSEVLRDIVRLHCPEGFCADLTYGNGAFWRGGTRPAVCYDAEPLEPFVTEADFTCLPVGPGTYRNIVIDPPFLTYVRKGRTGNGRMALAKRYAGYWRYDELAEEYQHAISEAYRVLKDGGKLVFKCQDIVHNHALQATHVNVIQWADIEGFRLLDLFVLVAQRRMPSPNRVGRQRHARIFHSYFLVFEKA